MLMFRDSLQTVYIPSVNPGQRESARSTLLMITIQQQLMKGLLGIYYDAGTRKMVPVSLDARHLNTSHKLYTVSVNEVTVCLCYTSVHLPIASKEQGTLNR